MSSHGYIGTCPVCGNNEMSCSTSGDKTQGSSGDCFVCGYYRYNSVVDGKKFSGEGRLALADIKNELSEAGEDFDEKVLKENYDKKYIKSRKIFEN